MAGALLGPAQAMSELEDLRWKTSSGAGSVAESQASQIGLVSGVLMSGVGEVEGIEEGSCVISGHEEENHGFDTDGHGWHTVAEQTCDA